MWTEGQYATEGLRQIAEFGSRSIMESELLEKVSANLISHKIVWTSVFKNVSLVAQPYSGICLLEIPNGKNRLKQKKQFL